MYWGDIRVRQILYVFVICLKWCFRKHELFQIIPKSFLNRFNPHSYRQMAGLLLYIHTHVHTGKYFLKPFGKISFRKCSNTTKYKLFGLGTYSNNNLLDATNAKMLRNRFGKSYWYMNVAKYTLVFRAYSTICNIEITLDIYWNHIWNYWNCIDLSKHPMLRFQIFADFLFFSFFTYSVIEMLINSSPHCITPCNSPTLGRVSWGSPPSRNIFIN